MRAIGRILLFAVILVIALGVGGYFILPPKASKSQTVTIERPAPAVFGFLSNAPPGSKLADGVTETKIISADANKVVAQVTFADGTPGTATFIVTPKGEKSDVQMTLEQPLGANPLERVDALTGGKVAPLFDTAAAQLTKDLSALPPGNPEGLAYEIVQVEPKPFLYNENCSPQDPAEIKEAVAQSLEGLRPLLSTLGVRQDGPPVAVETKWDDANKQYCFQIGFTYAGTARKSYLAKTGETPGGQAIKVHYTGVEDNVLPTYDKMEALVAAGRLQIGRSFEVYNDDPTQNAATGSVDRDIYYLFTGDPAALQRVQPTAGAAPEPAAVSATPAAASSAPASTSASAPASSAPATP